MKKISIALLSTLVLPAVAFAADTMREGNWELITTMEMQGLPFQIPPTRVEHCYTKEDVKDQKKTISTDKNCTVTDMKQTANRVTWKMKCTGKNPGVFSGDTVFKGDSFDSRMKMEGEERTMNMQVKAKRIGNCP